MNEPVWRKSSRSDVQGQCVEIASTGAAVALRDSKDPAGPVLRLPEAAWAVLLNRLKAR